jgi:hypothetical protein
MTTRFKLGDLVYPPYAPQKAGIVVEVRQPPDLHCVCAHARPIGSGQGIGAVLSVPHCDLLSGHAGDHEGFDLQNDGQRASWENDEPQPPRYHTPMPDYRMERAGGESYWVKSCRSLNELIEEHQAKVHTHEAMRERLLAHKVMLDLLAAEA